MDGVTRANDDVASPETLTAELLAAAAIGRGIIVGLFSRLADALERKNFHLSGKSIGNGLRERYGDRAVTVEEYNAYIKTRKGWTPALWEATVYATKMLRGDEVVSEVIPLPTITFVDSNYARPGLGEKLEKIFTQGPALTSWQDSQWAITFTADLATDIARFHNKYQEWSKAHPSE